MSIKLLITLVAFVCCAVSHSGQTAAQPQKGKENDAGADAIGPVPKNASTGFPYAGKDQLGAEGNQSKADQKPDNKWPEWCFSGALVALAYFTLRTYRRQANIMNAGHQSLFSIAQKFENQAFAWADRSFQVDAHQVEIHKTVIHTLSSYVQYLENYHKRIYKKISPAWGRFSGSGGKFSIGEGLYIAHPDWGKDYWINQLFEIADRIREI